LLPTIAGIRPTLKKFCILKKYSKWRYEKRISQYGIQAVGFSETLRRELIDCMVWERRRPSFEPHPTGLAITGLK
jgi:hypothetical protein